MMDVTIPMRTPTLNEWQRMHWAKRKRVGQELAWHLRSAHTPPARPLKRVHIRIERESTQTPDIDGLYGGIKPLLDALQPASKRHPYGLGYIVDDGPGCVVSLTAVHVAGKGAKTRIIMTEAAGG